MATSLNHEKGLTHLEWVTLFFYFFIITSIVITNIRFLDPLEKQYFKDPNPLDTLVNIEIIGDVLAPGYYRIKKGTSVEGAASQAEPVAEYKVMRRKKNTKLTRSGKLEIRKQKLK